MVHSPYSQQHLSFVVRDTKTLDINKFLVKKQEVEPGVTVMEEDFVP